eukprot:19413-Hanusia_phi.AAC.4
MQNVSGSMAAPCSHGIQSSEWSSLSTSQIWLETRRRGMKALLREMKSCWRLFTRDTHQDCCTLLQLSLHAATRSFQTRLVPENSFTGDIVSVTFQSSMRSSMNKIEAQEHELWF